VYTVHLSDSENLCALRNNIWHQTPTPFDLSVSCDCLASSHTIPKLRSVSNIEDKEVDKLIIGLTETPGDPAVLNTLKQVFYPEKVKKEIR